MNQVKTKFLNNYGTSEEVFKMSQLLIEVERSGLMVEVIHTALLEAKSNPTTTPLLALQIAVEDWDV
tara:strand:+ start:21 stop:221 length:201 start_codon:yes stop_codon:yes gene_type:complete